MIFTPDVPVLLIGAPGVGKTASVSAHFDHAEILLTSTLVEEDISGLPYREGEYDYRTVPGLFQRLAAADAAGKTTCLFLDELDKARRAVADTLLTLIASRRVAAASLPARTCIVAAANPPEFGGGDGISEAMLSRFAIIDFLPDVARWADWAIAKFSSAPAVAVIAAIRCGEMPIFDRTGEGLGLRISSPRTIAMALSALERHGRDSGAMDVLIPGLLTPAVASQFLYVSRNQKNEILTASVTTRKNVAKKSTQPVRL